MTMRSLITTHVLDTSRGRPAVGVRVSLAFHEEKASWTALADGVTNSDGRISDFLPESTKLATGVYRLTFDTASYFQDSGVEGFYPSIVITFQIRDPAAHYHVPVLLSPYGYSTYRGS